MGFEPVTFRYLALHSTTRPPRHVKKNSWTDICWITIQLRTTPQQQLKLNRESAKNIRTTFAFTYVSYLLYESPPHGNKIWLQRLVF